MQTKPKIRQIFQVAGKAAQSLAELGASLKQGVGDFLRGIQGQQQQSQTTRFSSPSFVSPRRTATTTFVR